MHWLHKVAGFDDGKGHGNGLPLQLIHQSRWIDLLDRTSRKALPLEAPFAFQGRHDEVPVRTASCNSRAIRPYSLVGEFFRFILQFA
jgi:hypothetical protein